MKKLLLTIAIVAMLVCAFAVVANAANITVDNINYITNGTNASFNANSPTDSTTKGELIIPEKITFEGVEYNVTSVTRGTSWPDSDEYINSVTKVVLPATITSVPEHIFRNYRGLKSVTIKGAVTSFNNAEFYSCYALEEVILEQPNSLTKIGGNVFSYCGALTTFAIPSTVTNVGGEAFRGCSKLTGVVNLPNLTNLGASAFRDCGALTGVTLGGTITSISSHCFYGAKSITYADLSGLTSVTSIDENGFRECYALADFDIPSSVITIGTRAFMSTKIKTLVIPNSVTTINGYAFNSCTSLETVKMGNNVTSIGDYAFQSCSSLKEFDFSNSLTTLGCNNFQGSKVTRIVLPATLTTTAKDMFHGSTLKEIVIANPTVSGYTSSLLANTGSLKLVFYAGNDATVLTAQIGQLSGWTNFVSYEQYLIDSAKADFTGYSAKTIVYGTDNCSSCSDIASDDTTFVYTDYLSEMYDNCICGNCGATSQVAEYKPMYRFQGYSAPEKNGVYAFCVGYATNKDSIKVFEAKTGKTVSFGVVAVATERMTQGSTPLEMIGIVPVICAPIENQYGSVTLKINGFTEAQKALELTMALYVTVTEGEASSTVYVQGTQTTSPSSYSIAQYESDLA